MKALILNISLSLFALSFFTACNSEQKTETATEQTETNTEVAGVTYTCPMHPEVISHEPGKCPECGMNLEKVKAGDQPDSEAAHQHKEGEQH